MFLQLVDLHAVSIRIKAVISGGFEHIPGTGAIPGNAAVNTHLFQSNPFLIICHHHRQTGGAAFKCLHLHDNGYFCRPFCERLSDLLLSGIHL